MSSPHSRIDRSVIARRQTHGLAAGRAALDRGDWEAALQAFEAVPAGEANSPRRSKGWGSPRGGSISRDMVFDVRERAYRALPRARRRRSARRAWRSGSRGTRPRSAASRPIANGWLQRARRLLDGQPDAPEHAWLAARAGIWALLDDGDPHEAQRLASEAVRVGQAIGAVDYEMVGRAVHGFARVTAGAVAEGLQELDEVNAAVLAGEMRDRVLIGLACCYLIAACERIHDYERATQWCDRLKAFCKKVGFRPLFAVCRTQYASVCMWRGAWDEAEHELTTASDELAACRPAMTGEGLVRLGELRRRQGKLDEAMALFDRVGGHPLAVDRPRQRDVRSRRPHRQRRSRRSAPPAAAGHQPHRAHRGAGTEGARLRRAGPARRRRGRPSPSSTPSPRSRARRRCARAPLRRRPAWRPRPATPTRRGRTSRTPSISSRRAARRSRPAARASSWRGCWARSGVPTRRVDEARRAIDDLAPLGASLELARARAVLDGARRRRRRPPGEDRKGLTPREIEVLAADFRGLEQPGHRGAAVHQRAHRAPARRQYADQAQRVVPLGGRRPGRPPGTAVSLVSLVAFSL